MGANDFIIPKRFADFEFNQISGGFRARTFEMRRGAKKYVFQFYPDDKRGEAQKKYFVAKKIKSVYPDCKINDIYEYKNNADHSFLVAEYIKGQTLDKSNENINSSFFSEIAKTLAQTHLIQCNEKFGTFTGNGSIIDGSVYNYGKEYDNISDFISSCIDNMKSVLKEKLSAEDMSMVSNKNNELLNYLSVKNSQKAVLTWRDLNPSNIMVSNGNFESLIDAGGCAYAIPELDLADVKTKICRNENDYLTLINEYKKHNNIDEESINKLGIFRETENIYYATLYGAKFQMPYQAHFGSILQKLFPNKLKKQTVPTADTGTIEKLKDN